MVLIVEQNHKGKHFLAHRNWVLTIIPVATTNCSLLHSQLEEVCAFFSSSIFEISLPAPPPPWPLLLSLTAQQPSRDVQGERSGCIHCCECECKWVTAGAGCDWPGLLRCRGTGSVRTAAAAAHRGADPPRPRQPPQGTLGRNGEKGGKSGVRGRMKKWGNEVMSQ